MKCTFCNIVKRKQKSHIVWEDKRFLAFLDMKPIKSGHILFIPKKHSNSIESLSNKETTDFFIKAKILMTKIKKATKAKKVAMALEGFGVSHTHLHLVPVNKGNDLNPIKAKKVTENSLIKVHKMFAKVM